MATDVNTAFPDIELAPGATITVDSGDANALITKLNVYGVSPVTGEPVVIQMVPPLFVYGPNE